MDRLYCIMGKSGAGKDTVFRALAGDPDLALRPVVPCTTRPPREGERDGVDYHFLSPGRFRELEARGRVLESRRYETVHGEWIYCTVDDGQFLQNGSLLMIATLEAFCALKRRFGEKKIVPVYLEVEDGVRLSRLLRREKRQAFPDYRELCRRFLADSADFSEEALARAGVARRFQNRSLSRCVAGVRAFILRRETFSPSGTARARD